MFSWLKRSVGRRVAALSALLGALLVAAVVLVGLKILLVDQPADVRREFTQVAVIAGGAAVVVVAIGTWLLIERLLSGALRDLTRVVRAAEKRQYLARARSDRTDEIGELSRAFDQLCSTITDLSAAMIDSDRELAWTKRELQLKEALSLLFELGQTINAESDLGSVLRAIPAKVAPALGYEEMAILLYDDRTGSLVVQSTFGFPPGDDVIGMTFAVNEGIVGIVAATGAPLVINDTAADQRYLHYKGKHTTDGAFVCVPMKLQGKLLGVFNVLRPHAGSFHDEDVRLLGSLASYSALAIAHAETTLRLHDLSVTDELTGVANRRLLIERLAREVERARRSERPLSALMVDLDHFKRVNDELGHLRGDDVLRGIARVLAENVRRLDTVGRYGGEEFALLLPDSPRAQALLVAEKLRSAVTEIAPGGVRLTVSVGVATLPDDATTGEALIDAADRALLAAKRAGRDRVVAYEPSLGRKEGAAAS